MRIRVLASLALAVTTIACRNDNSREPSTSASTADTRDSIDAVNAALTHQGIETDRTAWVVVDYFRERDGRLLRFVNTTPNVIDGTFLVWVSNSKEVMVLSEF